LAVSTWSVEISFVSCEADVRGLSISSIIFAMIVGNAGKLSTFCAMRFICSF